MEKFLIVLSASTLAANELSGPQFPFTQGELWSLAFVLAASLLVAISKEASKASRGPFKAGRFWGNVGLGVAAGMCAPLLIEYVVQHYTGKPLTGGASVGLGILGAYAGRDFLKAAYSALLSLGQAFAKLKGFSISYDQSKVKGTKKGGEDDA
ncbi:hypothetical protein [Deinococcus radiotolerans]|uniref:Uncharacterized protein n=1 Tax=Deinococcus radiotolerans TaxID=1309407 RepID=A0ABQ2FQA0_9DEIO|nr:hypothetical protein [Deinococcus radiotolerans]GGL16051.1 hypothetical protein GCM10010844_38660 [Deinococcus radiotolerans]